MRPEIFCLLLLAAALLAAPAAAQPAQPVVKVEVEPKEIAVGEPVTVTVTVLCPTFFPEPPRFPAGELANVITRLPEDGTYGTRETINGETWSGVVYNYEVFPLLGATYKFSGESVAVTCAEPGSIKGPTVDVLIDDVVFRAVVPPGAESLDPYVSGTSLKLDQRIEGERESLEAGDALVVTYVAELDGLPAMFLPPLVDIEPTPGLSVYPDQPVVEDGEPARRTERYTFVFEGGGDFVIPGARVDWWNRQDGAVESATVEPTPVSVLGPPVATAEAEQSPDEPINWRRILLAFLSLIIAWRLLSRLLPRIRAALDGMRERRLASEAHAFSQLEKALLGSDRRRAQALLLAWLARIAPELGPADFAARYGDDALRAELQTMSRAIYREGDEEIDLKRLVVPLEKARRQALRRRQAQSGHVLPSLNP